MSANLVKVKQSLVTYLKGEITVTSLLATPVEVREVEWQGTKFLYPCVRIRVDRFERQVHGPNCNIFNVNASVYVFAEDASSLKCDIIASEIFNVLDLKSFSDPINGVKFGGIRCVHIGADWVEERGNWSSVIQLTFIAS